MIDSPLNSWKQEMNLVFKNEGWCPGPVGWKAQCGPFYITFSFVSYSATQPFSTLGSYRGKVQKVQEILLSGILIKEIECEAG